MAQKRAAYWKQKFKSMERLKNLQDIMLTNFNYDFYFYVFLCVLPPIFPIFKQKNKVSIYWAFTTDDWITASNPYT